MRWQQMAAVCWAMVLAAGGALRAQEGGTRVGVCNPIRVLRGLDEWKAFEDKMRNDREKFNLENARRQAEVKELIRQRDELKPDSAPYKEKARLAAEKEVEYAVWVRMQELERTRGQKEQIRKTFDKIAEACKEIAESRKLDLVLSERRPELPQQDTDRLSPDDVAAILSQRDVLYSVEKVDITQAVILLMNKKYAEAAAAPAGQ